jgi:hypothetical protein
VTTVHVLFQPQQQLHEPLYTGNTRRFKCAVKFLCPIEGCESLSTPTPNLATHLQPVHEGVLPHSCDVCEKTFRYPSLLAKHEKMDEEPGDVGVIKLSANACANPMVNVVSEQRSISHEESEELDASCLIAGECVYHSDLRRHFGIGKRLQLPAPCER